eukprot:jgi/Tetstr1/437375/TSEL_026059.t1
MANLELPTVEQLAEAIAATISQRIDTPLELQHAQWLTDTMTAAGVEMHHHNTEPTLLPSSTPRSELLIHPFSQTIREAGELGGNTSHNHVRRVAIGMLKKARKTAPASLALRAAGRPVHTLTLQLTAHHHSIIGGTRGTDRTDQWRKTVSTAYEKIKAEPTPAPTERRPPAGPNQLPPPTTPAVQTTPQADNEEEELNYEENDSAMEVDNAQRAAAETPILADIILDSP